MNTLAAAVSWSSVVLLSVALAFITFHVVADGIGGPLAFVVVLCLTAHFTRWWHWDNIRKKIPRDVTASGGCFYKHILDDSGAVVKLVPLHTQPPHMVQLSSLHSFVVGDAPEAKP